MGATAAASGAIASGCVETGIREEVLFIQASVDHNGAFADRIIQPILAGLSDHSSLTAIKVNSLAAFISALNLYGPSADTLILAGHGGNSWITMAEDAKMTSAEFLERVSPPGCRKVVLISCSTGESKETSLAAKIAKTGREVLAPSSLLCTTREMEINPLFGHKAGVFPLNFSNGRCFKEDGSMMEYTGYEDLLEEPDESIRSTLFLHSTRKMGLLANALVLRERIGIALVVARGILDKLCLEEKTISIEVEETIVNFILKLHEKNLLDELEMFVEDMQTSLQDHIIQKCIIRLIHLGSSDAALFLARRCSHKLTHTITYEFCKNKEWGNAAEIRKMIPGSTGLSSVVGELFRNGFIKEGIEISAHLKEKRQFARAIEGLYDFTSYQLLEKTAERAGLFSFVRMVEASGKLDYETQERLASTFSFLGSEAYCSAAREDCFMIVCTIAMVCRSSLHAQVYAREIGEDTKEGILDRITEVLLEQGALNPRVRLLLKTIAELYNPEITGEEALKFGAEHLIDSPLLFAFALSIVQVDSEEEEGIRFPKMGTPFGEEKERVPDLSASSSSLSCVVS